uniref:Uncharacterized protein n=1 Tax=Trichobilharzia regenti TaxID=157069 RepID=A0AA85K1Q0_TRIRE|nr:unnamed protein product [Trichobilharzia regenti]
MCMLCRSPLFSMAVEVDFEEYSTDEEAETINTRYLRLSEQATTISSDKSELILQPNDLLNVIEGYKAFEGFYFNAFNSYFLLSQDP